MNIEEFERKVKCNWLECAHGMNIAANEGDGCYMQACGADPTDENCKKFITLEDYEKEQRERHESHSKES